jgi:methionyl aminopeptidase
MIFVKNKEQIELMRKANRLVRDVLLLIGDSIRAGISTKCLDSIAADYIARHNASASFLNHNGFPASICASINEEVVHGIPSAKRFLNEGDIIGVDVGAVLNGFHGDSARTFAVGAITKEKQTLIDVTRQSFFEGIKKIKEDSRVGDIGYQIQSYAEAQGCSVVRELVGHGIGKKMHEDPNVPNFGQAGMGIRLKAGMTIAIEPMINAGGREVEFLPDGWTVVTRDGSPSAHYENTVVILSDGVDILSI